MNTESCCDTQIITPNPRGGAATAVVDGRIYLLGGGHNQWIHLGDTDCYDTATGSWQSCASMPTPRSNVTCAVVDKSIYVIAGLMNPDARTTDMSIPSAHVEAFDTATGQWRRCADLPFARVKPAVAAVDGTIYAAGGRHEDTNTAQIVRYDPAADTWEQVGELPLAVRHAAGCAAGGKMYISGGWEAPAEPGQAPTIHDQLIEFDPATGACCVIAKMPTERCTHAMVAVDDRLYIIGGVRGKKEFLPTTDVYSLDQACWEKGPELQTGRAIFMAGVVDKAIHLVGGWSRLYKVPVAVCECLTAGR